MAGKMRRIQDWEFAAEVNPEEWETIDIQIKTKAEAVEQAREYANKHQVKVAVSTSIRIEDDEGVQDRDLVPGEPAPIIILPVKKSVKKERKSLRTKSGSPGVGGSR